MRGLTFCDGHFPFCVLEKAEDGEAFEEWDQVTYYDSALNGTVPSKSSTKMVTVLGQHTPYPVGLTLEELSALFWRVKKLNIGVIGLDAFTVVSAAPDNATGGYWDGGGAWVATSGTVDAIGPLAPIRNTAYESYCVGDFVPSYDGLGAAFADPPVHKTCSYTGPIYYGWNAYTSADVYVPIFGFNGSLPFRLASANSEAADESAIPLGVEAHNSASVEFGLPLFLFFESYSFPVLHAAGKYWPCFHCNSGLPSVIIEKNRSSQGFQESGDITVFCDEFKRCELFASPFDIPTNRSPSTFFIPFQIKLSATHVISFNLGLWERNDGFSADFELVSTIPTCIAEATEWWSYGGIYDEATGARV